MFGELEKLLHVSNLFLIIDVQLGADLIEQLRQKRMRDQEACEHSILEKIKMKMDRIKANQQKIQGPGFKEVNDHYVGKYKTLYQPLH